jgi:hypothetical protein
VSSVITHDALVEKAVRWLRNRRGCTAVFAELHNYGGEIPDAIGWRPEGRSILVEAKTSRSDFHADQAKPSRAGAAAYWQGPDGHRTNQPRRYGNERWYLAPHSVLRREDMPAGWGLLTVGDARGRVHVVVEAVPDFDPAIGDAERFLMVTALRRHAQGVRFHAPSGRFETITERHQRELVERTGRTEHLRWEEPEHVRRDPPDALQPGRDRGPLFRSSS